MTIDDKIKYEKPLCDINRKQQKYQHYHPEKLNNRISFWPRNLTI